MRKRFLSALLALCMALTLFPATALAADGEVERGYYGQKLTGVAQTIYDALCANVDKIAAGEAVRVPVITTAGSNIPPTINNEPSIAAAMAAVPAALNAVDYDCPEIFWTHGNNPYGPYMTDAAGNSTNLISPNQQYKLGVDVTVSTGPNWKQGGGRTVAADQTAINAKVAEIVAEARKQNSVYDVLKYAHDWLTSNNAYNTAAAETGNYSDTDATPWSAVSALLSGLSPVCEGYSRAFKLICDELGVPCILVSGTGINSTGKSEAHMWNYVQMGDNWYAVDVTWDDPTVNGADTAGVDTYFLVGSDTNCGGKTFKASHALDTNPNYPALSPTNFDNSTPVAKTPVTITAPATLSVVAGATSQINAATSPANLPLTYTSSNTAVATVDTSGVVTGVAAGSANITVSYAGDATHEAATATVNVTVTAAPVIKTDWDFAVSADKTSIKVGETAQITVTGADKEGVALSVDSAIASLNTATGELTANAVGTVTVTAVKTGDTAHNATTKTVTVTITKADEPAPPPVTPAEPVAPEVSARDITVEYGTPVTDNSIKGTATVPGTWAFVNTVPTAVGEHTMTVRFTPVDTTKYKAVETTLTLNITKRCSYARPAISGVKVALNDRPFNTIIQVDSRPGEGSYVLNVDINVNINANVTLQNLLEQMFGNAVWSGDVYYTSRARAGMGNGKIGYWHGDTRRFVPDADVVDVPLVDGFFTLVPDDMNYAMMTLLVVNNDTAIDDSETYYVSIPGVTGGEIIPNTRYAAYGERVTLNVHPESGYELDSLTVRDIRGRTLTLREVGGGKTQYTFNMPSCKVEVEAVFAKKDAGTAPSDIPGTSPDDEVFTGLGTPGISGIVLNPASMPFSDVKSSDWYYNYVEYMWKHYLMSGTSDTRFEPNLTTSRAMIWTIMARMNNVRTDINPGSTWYERGMLWAMEQGVTDGTNPMGNITREQLVTMLWRSAGKPNAGGTISQFSDAASVSGYAETAVRWAVGAGVLTGDNGRIDPQGTATRAQVAAMIARYGDKAA